MPGLTDPAKSKRKVLVAVADAKRQEAYKEIIQTLISQSVVFFAGDGIQIFHKIENDPPDVLLIDEQLPKLSGTEVVRRILHDDKHEMSIIILSELPDHQDFIDEVAVGQIQYLDSHYSTADISLCLNRAVTWISRGDQIAFSLRHLKSGEVLIRQGERAEFVYILKHGRMQAVSHEGKEEIILGQIEQQEFVGEMSYVTGEVRSADVVALTDCDLIEIPINHLSHLLFEKPSWSKALMKTLAKRLKSTNHLVGQRS